MLLVTIGILMMLLGLFYALIILAALTGLSLPGRNKAKEHSQDPFVSVIVPMRNEETRINDCLESLIFQEYPYEKYELIVSDDFSEDNTVDVVSAFIKSHPKFTCILAKGDPEKITFTGKKGAIARAVDIASGSLILTTDADTRHDPRWISSMVNGYAGTGAKMILGPVMFSETTMVFGKIQTLEFLGVMGLTAGFAGIGLPMMCNGANLLYEKSAFLEVEGYKGNEQYVSGDDQFLLWKFKQKYGAHSIHFLDTREAVVTTNPEPTIGSFLLQRFRWISKSRGYRDVLTLFVGAVTYLFQATIVGGCLLGFLSTLYLYLAFALFCFKILIDIPLVYPMARFFEKRHLVAWYIPAQLFQVVYVTVSVPLAFLFPVKWKGKRV